ncbi:MAG: hypothetical protein ACOC0O_05715 [Spirochaetota bacterium]
MRCRAALFVVAIALVSPLDETAAEARFGFVASPFLPVVTAGADAQFAIAGHLAWGFGVGGFYVLGTSVNAVVFLEPVYFTGGAWRLSGRAGVMMGINEEFPFGPPPEIFVGVGAQLSPLIVEYELPFRLASGTSMFIRVTASIQILTDFERVVGSPHVGIGAGMVHRGP